MPQTLTHSRCLNPHFYSLSNLPAITKLIRRKTLDRYASKKPHCKHKRSKVMTVFLLPALIAIFIMGWSLCTMDYQKGNYRIPHKLPKKDNVTIIPMAFEENKEINLSVAL